MSRILYDEEAAKRATDFLEGFDLNNDPDHLIQQPGITLEGSSLRIELQYYFNAEKLTPKQRKAFKKAFGFVMSAEG